ncbi:hypothetical protein IAR55_005405 [Kwoniella newhampshirensis]|uniref:Zn(2)-C6 fungal-type domain-containing protein n=1 Tax=Kwoniella newhampshirensis TaxID=1651941 RepID=A0AAW0YHA8_9TREE
MQQQNEWEQQRQSGSAPPRASSNDVTQNWYPSNFPVDWQQQLPLIQQDQQQESRASGSNEIQQPSAHYLLHHSQALHHATSNRSSLGEGASAEGADDSDGSDFRQHSREQHSTRKVSSSSLPLQAQMQGAGQAESHPSTTEISQGMEGEYSTFRNPSFSSLNNSSSNEHIAPSGTSLRRGMACRFCRRRKLRCSGERPACTSCVKYKQECEYQPPVRVAKVHALETRIAELSDYIHQGSAPGVPSAFSSQPLAYNEATTAQIQYSEYNYPDNLAQTDPQSVEPLPFNGFFSTNSNLENNPFHVTNRLQIPTGHAEYPPYASDVNQPVPLNTYLPPENTTATPYPIFGGTRSHLDSSGGPSPSNHPSTLPAQSVQFNPVLGSDFPSNHVAGNTYDGLGLQTNLTPASVPSSTPATYQFSQDLTCHTPTISHQGQFVGAGSTITSISPKPSNLPTGSSSTPSISTPNSIHQQPPTSSEAANLRYSVDTEPSDPLDGLTVRLGEFLFSPHDDQAKSTDEGEWTKKRRTAKAQNTQWMAGGRATSDNPNRTSMFQSRLETDGLKDEHRTLLLDCFLAHCRLFFEMSIPRFRYRMTFHDRRRPSLALLNAMYLWGTRMSNAPNLSAMEQHFFSAACRHLDSAGPSSDRLIDAVRAAMLLSAYSYTSGRHHEGWLIAGLAVRLVFSTGLHQIQSLTYRPALPENPFLRNRFHLLPPPEDAIELAERVHAFWCVFAIERCGALATGFPSAIKDEDIATPFGRPLDDIASQNVSQQDDVTIRDLYRGTAHPHPRGDTPYIRWVKAVTLLERASKLAFLEPTNDSEYTIAWTQYATALNSPSSQNPTPPPAWLNQPKYRNPKDFTECKIGLDKYIESLGVDGVSPIERQQTARAEGVTEPVVTSHTILLHHQFAATEMLLHDINSPDVENSLALAGARKAIDLFRNLPPLPCHEVDAQIILVWSMVAKVVFKELHRCVKIGDAVACRTLEADADTIITELQRIGETMHLSRTQAKGMEDLKKAALMANDGSSDPYLFSTGDDERRR